MSEDIVIFINVDCPLQKINHDNEMRLFVLRVKVAAASYSKLGLILIVFVRLRRSDGQPLDRHDQYS